MWVSSVGAEPGSRRSQHELFNSNFFGFAASSFNTRMFPLWPRDFRINRSRGFLLIPSRRGILRAAGEGGLSFSALKCQAERREGNNGAGTR